MRRKFSLINEWGKGLQGMGHYMPPKPRTRSMWQCLQIHGGEKRSCLCPKLAVKNVERVLVKHFQAGQLFGDISGHFSYRDGEIITELIL